LEDVVMQVSRVAVLLKYECARHRRAELVDLVVFKPNVLVANKIGVRQMLQGLHFDQDLFQPVVVVADRDAFAGELAQAATVEEVVHQEDNPLSASTQLPLLPKEGFEVIRAERAGRYALGWDPRLAGHKLCAGGSLQRRLLIFDRSSS
jgi:hypothetical protein